MNEDAQPITGLCIVEQTCPQGYVMIDKCEDNARAEADLWKDHLFAKKVKRFLCMTRIFPLAGGMLNNVLVDINILEEKDPTPPGYSAIATTQDTNEPAMKRKLLCAKLVARTSANDAINDIVFLSKRGKAPNGYTAAGELNGLTVCYRVGKVEQSGPPPLPPRPQQTAQPQYMNPAALQMLPLHGSGSHTYPVVQVAPQPQQSRVHPLAGVPFEISTRLLPTSSEQSEVPNFKCRTRENIMHEFDYPFFVEKQAQQTSQNYRNYRNVDGSQLQ